MSRRDSTTDLELQRGCLRSSSAEQTLALGRALGELLAAGDVIGLVGDLGAGKTCFTQGIARGLQVDAEYRMASPTFTLINEYPARVALFHIDLYRLGDVDEMYEVGILEAIGGPQVCVVEWFDRLDQVELPDYLRLELRASEDEQRHIALSACGTRHVQLAQRWLSSCPDDAIYAASGAG
jgi:tRNA threonylcarbamoyladenosine biosynthesis protein TsaE